MRESGWYRVKSKSEKWEFSLWEDRAWLFVGDQMPYRDIDMIEIDPTRQDPEPKPPRLALYGRLIQKKFILYQMAAERGNRDRSLLIQDEIVNITERMQREENQ